MLTVPQIIKEGLLDEYMPNAKEYKSKQNIILNWIKEGELQVARGGYKKRKLVPQEAIELFKQQFIIK